MIGVRELEFMSPSLNTVQTTPVHLAKPSFEARLGALDRKSEGDELQPYARDTRLNLTGAMGGAFAAVRFHAGARHTRRWIQIFLSVNALRCSRPVPKGRNSV